MALGQKEISLRIKANTKKFEEQLNDTGSMAVEENSSIDSEPALGKHQDFSWGEIQLPDKF